MTDSDGLTFSLYPWRFAFCALDSLQFDTKSAGNLIRGAFGVTLRQIACVPECPGFAGRPSSDCPQAQQCEYARLFEPSAPGAGPSGLSNMPRPFVLRTSHLISCTVQPGAPFYVDLHLFDTSPKASSSFASVIRVFKELANRGFGPRSSRVELTGVTRVDRPAGPVDSAPLALSLKRREEDVSGVAVEFRTPTELKNAGEIAATPEFPILFRRIRDRVTTLRSLYGDGPLAIDFRGMAKRAEGVRIVRSALEHVEVSRRSSRTGETHGIGGLAGRVEYAGELTEFLPWLEAAEWTGVGRHTVWGNGEIRVISVPASSSSEFGVP